MKIDRKMGVRERIAMERAAAQAAQNAANIEYIAMMSDIDLDIDESEDLDDE